ncbi:MAG: transcription termination factor Rho [Chthoniobacteraceae bacterium]
MTAPSQTSTDKPASSQPVSGDTSPEPDSEPQAIPPDASAPETDAAHTPEVAPSALEPAETAAPISQQERPPELQPRDLWIDELHALTHRELLDRADLLRLRVNAEKNRHHLVFDLLRAYHALGFKLFAEGITEFITSDGCGFIRFPRYSFRPGPQDPFLSFQLAKRLQLKGGHLVTARVRPPGHREKYMTVEELLTIEGVPVAEWKQPKDFDTLTARFPDARVTLDNGAGSSLTARAVDLIAPIGRGQRGLLVAPPRAGKTILMKELAQAAIRCNPGLHVILLLVDERPEEVTDIVRSVHGAEIYCSTFDEPSSRHIQVAEIVADRARRLVEMGRHVLIFLDSITRLSRGYNNAQPGRGRTMSGGVDTRHSSNRRNSSAARATPRKPAASPSSPPRSWRRRAAWTR